jgi:hypothetical protein
MFAAASIADCLFLWIQHASASAVLFNFPLQFQLPLTTTTHATFCVHFRYDNLFTWRSRSTISLPFLWPRSFFILFVLSLTSNAYCPRRHNQHIKSVLVNTRVSTRTFSYTNSAAHVITTHMCRLRK